MVDLVTEIPLPGRVFNGPSDDGPIRVATTAFIAGPENCILAGAVSRLLPPAPEKAHGAVASIASSPATPKVLAIHGPSGTGKTHLARGIVQWWQERFGADSADYLSAADFRHTLNEAIKTHTVVEFRRRMRGRRLLAIDGLDRLPNGDNLQQELRYTIDALEENDGILVVVSSHAASALRNLSAGVRSRLASGLKLRLAPPDDAARREIIRNVSAALGSPLSEEAARRLAAGVRGTALDLFGALFELHADCPRRGSIDIGRVERYLSVRAARRPTFREILQVVAKYYRIPQRVLKSGSRRQSAVTARSVAVYLARELAAITYERIGRGLGGRDHTTAMHSYRKIKQLAARDPATRDAIEELQHLLRPIWSTAASLHPLVS